jgi:hypothetical protein
MMLLSGKWNSPAPKPTPSQLWKNVFACLDVHHCHIKIQRAQWCLSHLCCQHLCPKNHNSLRHALHCQRGQQQYLQPFPLSLSLQPWSLSLMISFHQYVRTFTITFQKWSGREFPGMTSRNNITYMFWTNSEKDSLTTCTSIRTLLALKCLALDFTHTRFT